MAASKRSRLDDLDLDDDLAVERHLASTAKRAAAALDKALTRAAPADPLPLLAAELARIQANLALGDAIFPVTQARLFLSLPLTGRFAATVLCVHDPGAPPAPDLALLQAACGHDGGMGEPLARLEARFPSPALAMPALVEASPATRGLPPAERARLAARFSAWLAGAEWRECRLSGAHRPSLASWDGWPWDAQRLASRCLARGQPAAAAGRVQCVVLSRAELLMATGGGAHGVALPLSGDPRAALEEALRAARAEAAEAAEAREARARRREAAAGKKAAAAGKKAGASPSAQ